MKAWKRVACWTVDDIQCFVEAVQFLDERPQKRTIDRWPTRQEPPLVV
jgi:hypothetical protein